MTVRFESWRRPRPIQLSLATPPAVTRPGELWRALVKGGALTLCRRVWWRFGW